MFKEKVNSIHQQLLTRQTKEIFERATIFAALGGFFLHLFIILLANYSVFSSQLNASIGNDPIKAIYTPFSVILFYEVFLFVYYLPDSFSVSIGKQYEIASLIIIRKIFKDISEMDLISQWWISDHNFSLLLDMLGIVLIFFLIYRFYKLTGSRPEVEMNERVENFITTKKFISLLLVPVLMILALYSLGTWLYEIVQYNLGQVDELSDVNSIFYDDFFTILILVDVFILILSLIYTSNYSQLIRNSGFIISTILIRLSFQAENHFGIVLASFGVLFGVFMLLIFNRYERVSRNIE